MELRLSIRVGPVSALSMTDWLQLGQGLLVFRGIQQHCPAARRRLISSRGTIQSYESDHRKTHLFTGMVMSVYLSIKNLTKEETTSAQFTINAAADSCSDYTLLDSNKGHSCRA